MSAGCPFLINPKNYIREKDNERDLLAQDTNEKGELKKKKMMFLDFKWFSVRVRAPNCLVRA